MSQPPTIIEVPQTNGNIRLEQTTNGDFLICPHPKFNNLHLATGGSLHGWKFLPLLGEFVVDSIAGTLDQELVKKWSWESKAEAKHNTFGFMTPGEPKEFRENIGHRPELEM